MAENMGDLPWGPTSRSYNLAVRIIEDAQKGAVPKDRPSQKEYFASLANAFGVNRHTVTNIMHVLKSTKRIHSVTPGSTVPSSQEGPSSQRNDAPAPFTSQKVPSESTAGPTSTVPETAASPKVPEEGGKGEIPPQEVPKVPSESPASTASTILSPEELETFRTLVKNYPEMMRQIAKEGAREYVQGIGGPVATNPEDVEMQANLKIESGSAVARMVYLMRWWNYILVFGSFALCRILN